MDRNEEYNNLLAELDKYPIELNTSLDRAKIRRNKDIRRHFIAPLTFIVSLMVVFITMVNYSTSFAYACGRIPVIDDLAKLVTFSSSLKAAVDNEYVQPINQEQTKNGLTMKIEYVIVDQKQLNIFYSISPQKDSTYNIYPKIENDLLNISYVLQYSSFEDSLNLVTIDFFDSDMPNSLKLSFEVTTDESIEETIPGKEYLNSYKDMNLKTEVIETFEFELEFDPFYTSQGENIELNHSFEINNEVLTLKNVEIYPTHMRVNFSDIESNTAWMESISFYIENEKGERFEKSSHGVSATGSPDSPMMSTQLIESSFFSDSKELTLYITNVTWLDKDMKRLKLDLANVTADILPEGVTFESAVRHGDNWTLSFIGKLVDGFSHHQIWNTTYYDETGRHYSYDKWSYSTLPNLDSISNEDVPNSFRTEIPLVNYKNNTVYLEPISTRYVKLPEPIVLTIK